MENEVTEIKWQGSFFKFRTNSDLSDIIEVSYITDVAFEKNKVDMNKLFELYSRDLAVFTMMWKTFHAPHLNGFRGTGSLRFKFNFLKEY